MISVNNISLYFGGQTIFNNVSFMINAGDKIGLVGKNGVGKSTLLRILAQEQTINEGDINISNNIKIGYLQQDLDFVDGKTIIEEAKSAFSKIEELEYRLHYLQEEMNKDTDYESDAYLDIINEFHDVEEKFRILGGHEIKSTINQVLMGLGFLQEDFQRQTDEFSGGWRMRIELAKILLRKPDILLLDEPTNHLDIESIIWIEKWLKSYNGAIVLVSHDKEFLDNITNRTIEISFSKINTYKAAYTKYIELRKDRIEKQMQAKKNQDKFIEETEVLINKFRAKKNKAAFAQTLIRKLEKLEIIEVEKEDVGKIKFQFPPSPHSGKVTLLMKNILKDYGDLRVLENVDLEITRGEKIAFVGKNGEGKSTLAKIIVNEIDSEGEINIGHQVKIGYYAQNQSDYLDENKTVFETIYESTHNETSQGIRNILGSFLFSNDTVEKKIKVLSGGERARVALCKLLLDPVNLLVMDEPTNHLDMHSKELLKQALIEYDGSLIIVSHDREFLDGLSEKVYEFKDQNIKQYLGDINSFLKEKKVQNFKEIEKTKQQKTSSKDKISDVKRNNKEMRIISKKIKKVEKDIDKLEKKISVMDQELANPTEFKNLSQDGTIFIEYEKYQLELKKMNDQWEELNLKLEKLSNDQE